MSNAACWFSDETTVIPNELWNYGSLDKTLVGVKAWGGRNALERLPALIETGRMEPEKMITHRFHGLKACEDALTLMGSKTDDLIKPIVCIDD